MLSPLVEIAPAAVIHLLELITEILVIAKYLSGAGSFAALGYLVLIALIVGVGLSAFAFYKAILIEVSDSYYTILYGRAVVTSHLTTLAVAIFHLLLNRDLQPNETICPTGSELAAVAAAYLSIAYSIVYFVAIIFTSNDHEDSIQIRAGITCIFSGILVLASMSLLISNACLGSIIVCGIFLVVFIIAGLLTPRVIASLSE